ncbi:MAG: DUF3793 family protein [Planctomycetia bacterium]|nr:DUF3793 family protein [Planctomycetia bacterium]
MKHLIHIGCLERQRELMRFLLLQTALVRGRIKPGEVFTLNRCYSAKFHAHTPTGICVHQDILLQKLGLSYRVLRNRECDSLVLFYDMEMLKNVLENLAIRQYLYRNGYSHCVTLDSFLLHLQERFSEVDFPHEIGLFLGYPLKDVIGFVSVRSRLTHQGSWRVYGKLEPSLTLMNRFREARRMAEFIIDQHDDWDTCAQKISLLKFLI